MWRKAGYFLLTAVTFYLAVLYNSKAFLMLGMLELSLFPFLLVTLWYQSCRLKFRLELPKSAQDQSRESQLVLLAEPESLWISRMQAELWLEHRVSRKRRRIKLKEVKGTEGVKLMATMQDLEVGMWKASLKRVRAYDCLGCFSVRKRVKETGNFMVLPVCHETNIRVGIRTRLFWSDGEQYDPHINGDDPSEIMKLREYQNGDRMNMVHWKLSARNDALIVKERSLPMGCNVVFFLDPARKKEKQNIRSFWEITYTICSGLLEQKCYYYLSWYEEKGSRMKRKAIKSEDDLYVFWGEIQSYVPGTCDFPKEYSAAFQGERYASGILLNGNLEVYCNGRFVEKLDRENLKQALAEMELNL